MVRGIQYLEPVRFHCVARLHTVPVGDFIWALGSSAVYVWAPLVTPQIVGRLLSNFALNLRETSFVYYKSEKTVTEILALLVCNWAIKKANKLIDPGQVLSAYRSGQLMYVTLRTRTYVTHTALTYRWFF